MCVSAPVGTSLKISKVRGLFVRSPFVYLVYYVGLKHWLTTSIEKRNKRLQIVTNHHQQWSFTSTEQGLGKYSAFCVPVVRGIWYEDKCLLPAPGWMGITLVLAMGWALVRFVLRTGLWLHKSKLLYFILFSFYVCTLEIELRTQDLLWSHFKKRKMKNIFVFLEIGNTGLEINLGWEESQEELSVCMYAGSV
jgi:hypothetical protein